MSKGFYTKSHVRKICVPCTLVFSSRRYSKQVNLSNYQGHLMSSVGLNKWIVSGHLAADAEIKTVELKNGEKAKVAKGTIYVRKGRSRDESFTVSLSIWEGSAAWRRLPFLKKGSLIICTGSAEPNPYISNSDNLPKAGLSMNVIDIDLDNVRSAEEEATPDGAETSEPVPVEATVGTMEAAGTDSKTRKAKEKTSTPAEKPPELTAVAGQ